MKNVITRVLILLFTAGMYAQQGINYKALINDNSGNVVSNQVITVQFQILEGSSMSNVYQETHSPTTDADGLIIVNIGEGIADSGVFEDIDWGSDTHYLNTQIDTGAGLVDMGTKGFNTVPYALQAKVATTATTADNGVPSGGIEGQILTIVGGEPAWSGTSSSSAEIGEVRAGGIVFWVDPADSAHGLVCAYSDYAIAVEWGCDGIDLTTIQNVASNSVLSGPGSEIGDGLVNTNGILNDCSSVSAASVARSYGPDWFLPSINELKEMYNNKATLESISGFSAFASLYWSSSEHDSDKAWSQNFSLGGHESIDKNSATSVRVIRAF